jgi:DNA-binding beta-propeller fold protein YncE
MKKRIVWALAAVVLIGGFAMRQLISQGSTPQRVGPLPDGGFLLNSGWTIRPAGTQVPVDTFPMSTAISRNGKFLLVLNAGYNPPSISVIDIAQKKEVGRTKVEDAFLGLTVSPVADKVYVGGGTTGKVFEMNMDPNSGALTPAREFPMVKDLAAKGDALIGDVAVTYDAHILYATDLYDDQIAVVNLQTGLLIATFKTGQRPYKILLPPGGEHLLVSAWGEGLVYEHNATSGELIRKIRVGPHPTDMAWLNRASPTEDGAASSFGARLFVAAANTNDVYSFGESSDGQFTQLETINLSMTPLQPLGMTPTALGMDAKGTMLYAVCSDGNAVAAIDITATRSRVAGFIPTGWYPTAVRLTGDGEVVIVNGKGLGSMPNPKGPNPSIRPAVQHAGGGEPPQVQYVGHIQTGTVEFLATPDEAKLMEFTGTVRRNSPYSDDLIELPPDSQQTAFFQRTDNHASPIEHVIYVIKENRTYDQVLGDLPKGNGDPSLVLFGEKYTPNLHRLAQDYILYDNFYENADVSAEGHNWASAAIAPDYTVKLWPSEYGKRSKVYDFEGGESANTPPAGYLWTNAMQAGVSVRDYGQWTTNFPIRQVVDGVQIKNARDPSLTPYVDKKYRGWDLDYPDVERAKEFSREWNEFDAAGKAPAISILRMGNDHTKGTAAGALTPFSYNADNDYGVGMLVDTVSHSKLWATTAIFIIEDDSQNGPDHVDSHRAPAWVISPYTKRGIVDSGMYNQMSVLRSMELIVGLRPMTQFDAAARPMFESFSKTPDTTPYTAIQPKVSLTDRNPGQAVGAAESARMDFHEADLVDDDELTAVLWHAIKHTDPPAPTRSLFGR